MSRVFLTIAFTCGVAALRAAQITTPASAEEVRVHVIVTKADGTTPASGPGQDDFEIVADGTPVPVRSFSLSRSPLTLVVLLDVTGSVYLENEKAFSTAIEQSLIAHLAPGDRMLLGRFGSRTSFSPTFTTDPLALKAAVRQAFMVPDEERHGPSPIWDALDAALATIEREPGRKAIVLITDGKASGNVRRLRDVIRHAALADVAVFVVGEGGEAMLPVHVPAGVPIPYTAAVNMRDIAERTGGLYFVDGFKDSWQRPKPGPFFLTMLAALRATYVLGFVSPAVDGEDHTLEVRARRAGLLAHARSAYRGAAPARPGP